MTPIYGYPYGPGFGDLWLFANNLAFLSAENTEVRFNPVPRMFPETYSRQHYLDTIFEILPNLNGGTGKIIPVEDPPTHIPFRYKEFYCPTKIRYYGKPSKIIVYQEDGRAITPSEQQIKSFFDCMSQYGDFTFVRLGLPLTVEQSIKAASEAKAFIGFQSGMTHLCLSVGVPVFLTEMAGWFFPDPNKYGATQCSSIAEMFNKACS